MFQDAAEALTAARRAEPYNPFVHFLLGRTALGRKDFETAKEEFQVTLNLEPSAVSPLLLLAGTYIGRIGTLPGARAEAASLLRTYFDRRPSIDSDRFAAAGLVGNMDEMARSLSDLLMDVTGDWIFSRSTVNLLEEDGTVAWSWSNDFLLSSVGTLRRLDGDRIEGEVRHIMKDGCAWVDLYSLRQSPDGLKLTGHSTMLKRTKRGTCDVLVKPGTTTPVEMTRPSVP
jgi:hypothetical protein